MTMLNMILYFLVCFVYSYILSAVTSLNNQGFLMKKNIFAIACINIIALSSISLFASCPKPNSNGILVRNFDAQELEELIFGQKDSTDADFMKLSGSSNAYTYCDYWTGHETGTNQNTFQNTFKKEALHFLSELFVTHNGPIVINAREYARAQNEACKLQGTELIFSEDTIQKYISSIFTNTLFNKYQGGMPLQISDVPLKALPAPRANTKTPIAEDSSLKNLRVVMRLTRGSNT